MRIGTSISVAAHVAALTACLVLAGVRPFDPTTAEAIRVDLVTPDEAPKPKEKDPFEFPSLSEKEPAQEPAQQTPPPPPPEPAKSKPQSQQAAVPPKPAEQQKPAEPPTPPQPQAHAQAQAQQQAPAEPQQQSQAQPDVPAAAPDITTRFGLTFAMPDGPAGDFDAKATAAANISVQDAAALRAHIKSCSVLPKSVSVVDNVRIVLRVAFGRDGRLAKEPLLIEASASEKGPALMRGAIEALENCQPYAMLPAERYNEWRMLDLSFTPKDFKG